MPQFERYPGEDPVVARKRIAKNKAVDRNPTASAESALSPERVKLAKSLNAAVAGSELPRVKPRLKGGMMRKGYNFTKNLGETPDIGY